MEVLDWLLILGVGLVYLFVLLAVIWLVFRRSRAKRPHDPSALKKTPPGSSPVHTDEGDEPTKWM